MATITKRNGKLFVQIRRKGFTPRYRTFLNKSEATAWARHEEHQIDYGMRFDRSGQRRKLTLNDVLERYKLEVTPKKRGAEPEAARIAKMQREPMCDLSLIQLSPSAIADFREKRLSEVKPATVKRELSILRHAIDLAKKEWGAELNQNPVHQIEIPVATDARERRLEAGEYERVLSTARQMRNPLTVPLIIFAVETAMRRSEILRLEWQDIDLVRNTAIIRQVKNGHSRTIPLTSKAMAVVGGLESSCGVVFPISANALRQGWVRLCRKAEITDLRFHDLRHEAISRLCELGLSIPEVALISGHRDPRMLFRYAHIRPIELAQKIRRLSI